MSLLLEALKRAEVDFKNRKKAAADGHDFSSNITSAPSNAPTYNTASTPATAPELASVSAQLKPQSTPDITDFPELYLTVIEPPATQTVPAVMATPLAPPPVALTPIATAPLALEVAVAAEAASASARQSAPPAPATPASSPLASPTSAHPAIPIAAPSVVPPPASQSPIPIAPATPRQALTAAAVLAGARQKKPSAFKQRRTLILSSVALLIALPLLVFLIGGDKLQNAMEGFSAAKLPIAKSIGVNNQASTPTAAIATPSAVATRADTSIAAIPAFAAGLPAPANTPNSVAKTSSPVFPVGGSSDKSSAINKPRVLAPKSAAPNILAGKTNADTASNSLSVTASTPKPASAMESAYIAYQAGKTEDAARLYREVLKNDPTQPDAWLGLAVIAHANNQREPAMSAYKRVLRLEPQNPTALAGINSLNNNSASEPRQESNLRELLARSPQEADLNHALGVVLSGERRWSEAQPLFFKAHALSPQEPQYAYNLAVTLDHLRKSALAAQYYETALALAQGKASAFDENSARARLAALKLAASPKTTP